MRTTVFRRACPLDSASRLVGSPAFSLAGYSQMRPAVILLRSPLYHVSSFRPPYCPLVRPGFRCTTEGARARTHGKLQPQSRGPMQALRPAATTLRPALWGSLTTLLCLLQSAPDASIPVQPHSNPHPLCRLNATPLQLSLLSC
ncbi:hypothetical protein NDU88_001513 [Pleurodeles waltl]|uniref:Uncharacterized protein n=1 Tax=Pleurodeles waltl TaxID=8319 RepID=A0AAV7WKR2_PLEWA|nr:hypothetical protein NDU88_001513 [Pleurodeles waltl]